MASLIHASGSGYFPFCISEDSWMYNLQLLKPKQSRLKTKIEKLILNKLKKEGMIESITHYSLELKAPQREVMKRFIELWKESAQKYPEIDFKTCTDTNVEEMCARLKPSGIYSL